MADDSVVVLKSQPVKPGNSVEGKTLATRKGRGRLSWKQPGRVHPKPGYLDNAIEIGEVVDERWQWSHRGAATELRGKDQKTTRGDRISSRDPVCKRIGVVQVPGPSHKAPGSPVILGEAGDHGEAK